MMGLLDKYKVTGVNNASFWKKLLAFFVDLIIINIIIFSQFSAIFGGYFGNISIAESFSSQVMMPPGAYWVVFVMMMLVMLYFSFFDYYLGQTPGKMLVKIRVINVENNTKKSGKQKGNESDITLWRAIIRNCYILPFFPFYLFWIIEPIYLALYNERLLERLTYTRTVDEQHKIKYSEYKLSKV